MNILLDSQESASNFTVFIITGAVVVPIVIILVLVDYIRFKHSSAGGGLLLAAFALLILGAPAIWGLSYIVPLPASSTMSHIEMNEQSLNEQSQEEYGYKLVQEIEAWEDGDHFESWEEGAGVYAFQPEDGNRVLCAVQSSDVNWDDPNYPTTEKPEVTEDARLMCALEGSSLQEPASK